jgi:UDP-N-acetylmuramyl-tripeptide synthetase
MQAAAGPAPVVRWLRSRIPAAAHLRLDSRTVGAGDIFIAVAGRRTDGAAHLGSALARGARALLVDPDIATRLASAPPPHAAGMPPAPVLAVQGLRSALGAIAAEYYGNPTAQMRTIGITGTNGKTSSCLWLAQVLGATGRRCATLGTLGFGFPEALRADQSTLTTPDAVSVQRLAREARDQGAAALSMEVSSIGLDQGRVDGVHFEVALFTNLSRDHLDYHADMADYAAAKRKLFDWPGLRHAVLNLDDAFGRELAAHLGARPAGQRPAITGVVTDTAYAASAGDRRLDGVLRAEAVEHRPQGLRFRVVYERAGGSDAAVVDTGLFGAFNVANLLGVLGAALACGVTLAEAVRVVAPLQAPPGRLQRVARDPAATGAGEADEPLAIVDYAHTPDAIAKALQALRPIAQARGGRLWIVFGAGGDRDRGKRPVMAAAAAAADAVILTSDNPRGENAESILDDLAAGMPAGAAFDRLADRAAAIQAALQRAAARDVVLIAGKGHEDYQEIAGQRLPFSDAATARTALGARAAAAGAAVDNAGTAP